MFARKRLKKSFRRSVVVHTVTENSIQGVLVGAYDDVVVLSHASYVDVGGNRIRLEGEQLIPNERIEFIQELVGAASAANE